jgi:response regulator NasT
MQETKAMSDPSSNSHRILLVEDDRLIAATLAAGLRQDGYTVIVACSGEDAQALLDAHDFDLAILDEQLPGMTGLELAGLLHDRYALPAIFLTAFGDPGRVRSAVEKGAFAYLIKPVDIEQLLPALRTALARAEDIRQLKDTETHLQRALDERREISIAVGILMERLQLQRQPAFEVLRKTARAQRRRIEDVARDVMLPTAGSTPRSGAGQ